MPLRLAGYPFVASKYRYGTRTHDVLAILAHMAEGGGTVGYLSVNGSVDTGVSVGFVIERTGRCVQMLGLEECQGGVKIRHRDGTSALRRTNDAGSGYGYTIASLVMGASWAAPNQATIQVEFEGTAAEGPNPAQRASWVKLVADLKASGYARMKMRGALVHRDYQDWKACPGTSAAIRAALDAVGGHGLWAAAPAPEVEQVAVYEKRARSGQFTVKAGTRPSGYDVVDGAMRPVKTWNVAAADSSAPFDHVLVKIGGTGPGWLLHVPAGFFAGLYVPTSQVEETYDPPATAPTPAVDFDAIRVAIKAADDALLKAEELLPA